MKRLAILLIAALAATANAQPEPAPSKPSDPLAQYYAALEQMKLIDTESGTLETLRHDLQVSELLLRDGAFLPAAVALYAIVESPRYSAFHDFVEFQNAEYDLGVALARAGSYGASLDALEAVLRRGPASPYYGPAHRRAVDIALETRDHAGVLARLEAIKSADPIPASAAGERAYLRGRAAYDQNKLADAEGELVTISKKSRMYSSAVYLRGVIRARRGEYKASAEAMCEIAATPDTDKFTFVVDERYFTVKDLARLGLGRIAHEQGEYDDAYYHYFQIPDDSQYLPDALFEAAWSMYQKRELATARDLVAELLKTFPTSPLWPETSLLAGYVELADCKFDDSQKWYDKLVERLQPIVDELDKARKDPELRRELFASALTRYQEVKTEGTENGKKPGTAPALTPRDEVLALLRLDPQFLRLSDAVTGSRALANSAGTVTAGWEQLAKRTEETAVGAVAQDISVEQQQKNDADAVGRDLVRLAAQVAEAKDELARARREGTLQPADADEESKRLDELAKKVTAARGHAADASEAAAGQITQSAQPSLRPLLTADIADARRLDKAAHAMADKLSDAGEQLAQASIEKLYKDTRHVLDKAKLGKVDAVIGQKRKLDIEVTDLAQGRFPEELIGHMWDQSQIADDEEYWPWQGEFWADEYSGFR
jgi:TolA-binding protein